MSTIGPESGNPTPPYDGGSPHETYGYYQSPDSDDVIVDAEIIDEESPFEGDPRDPEIVDAEIVDEVQPDDADDTDPAGTYTDEERATDVDAARAAAEAAHAAAEAVGELRGIAERLEEAEAARAERDRAEAEAARARRDELIRRRDEGASSGMVAVPIPPRTKSVGPSKGDLIKFKPGSAEVKIRKRKGLNRKAVEQDISKSRSQARRNQAALDEGRDDGVEIYTSEAADLVAPVPKPTTKTGKVVRGAWKRFVREPYGKSRFDPENSDHMDELPDDRRDMLEFHLEDERIDAGIAGRDAATASAQAEVVAGLEKRLKRMHRMGASEADIEDAKAALASAKKRAAAHKHDAQFSDADAGYSGALAEALVSSTRRRLGPFSRRDV